MISKGREGCYNILWITLTGLEEVALLIRAGQKINLNVPNMRVFANLVLAVVEGPR